MNKNQIKEYLLDNPQKIKDILEDLGCDNVKIIQNKRVQSSRPNFDEEHHDNKSSIQVKLNKMLSVIIYTDNEFKKQEYADIFSLIEYIKQCKFNRAIKYVCNICGIKYTGHIQQEANISESYNFIKKYKNRANRGKGNIIQSNHLDESFLSQFIRNDCKIFIDDNINSLTQAKFQVSYDSLDNRVVFPIRDDLGKLLTFKGRTLDKNYKINGTPKYIYYYTYIGEQYLFGLYENYFDILSSNELYIFEAEKSVMQCDSMGINNCVSINKKTISPIQLNKLLKLGKTIVLCFDKDVTLEEISVECKKFKGLCKVYYIYDVLNLLGKKESPSDNGLEIFLKLSKECRFEYTGG